MNETPSSEPESPEHPVYEKPVLVEYGTLLELTLSGSGAGQEAAFNPGGTPASV